MRGAPDLNDLHRDGRFDPFDAEAMHSFRDFALTDLGNAERLVARHGNDLRFCQTLGGWLCWDGKRWRLDVTGEADRRAKATARAIADEEARNLEGKERDYRLDHGRRSESDQRIRAMLSRARVELSITVEAAAFDADDGALNCENGTLDLRTGILRPHRREALCSKLAPTAYNPAARCEAWERFLAEATGGDLELGSFLQRAAGYSLSGDTREDSILLLHGPGGSGKSTILEALRATLGDYASVIPFEALVAREAGHGPREAIVSLVGARLAIASEVEPGRRFRAGLLKALSGGDTLFAHKKYAHGFQFKARCKLWLACNVPPDLDADDNAAWRRVRAIPFLRVPAKPDLRLRQRLQEADARAAVLAWAFQGLVQWREQGLGSCGAVREATAGYRRESNHLAEFIESVCVLTPTAWTPTATLRAAFDRFSERAGENVSPRAFAFGLTAAGCQAKSRRDRGAVVRGWLGIGLLAAAPDAQECSR